MTTTSARARRSKVFSILGIVLGVWCVVSFVATKLIYDRIFVRYDPPATATPSALTALVETRTTVSYHVQEHTLTGYLYRPDGQAREALVVLAPGFHACADDYLWQIAELLDKGWAVFAFDSTGHCHSKGDSCVGFPQELVDLEATLSFLRDRAAFGFEKLVLFGHSRGAYAACCAADSDRVVAVIAVSGINSAMEGVMSPAIEAVGPLAYGNYPFLWAYQTALFGGDVANREASSVLSACDVPTMLVHGSADDRVPPDVGSIVSHIGEIDNPHVQVMLCDRAGQDGHTNLLFDTDGTANDALMERIHRFLEENVR